MNWVEKEHAKKVKLEEDSGPVLSDVIAAIDDAVKKLQSAVSRHEAGYHQRHSQSNRSFVSAPIAEERGGTGTAG
jgi:ribosome-associated translation inhibitor RaiA